MRIALWLLLASTLPAQGQPLGSLVDSVMATVNDSAILHSTVRTVAVSRIRSLIAERRQVSASDEKAIVADVLEDEIDRHRLAQSAKSLGPISPEQIDSIVKGETERLRQEQLKDFGTMMGVNQELKRTRRTWPTMQKEQAVDQLHDIALQIAVGRRLQKQTNLLVTPRMLREAYHQLRDRFVREAAAEVVQVKFTGPDAAANAEKAAAAWRQEDLDARQLADKFPGAVSIGGIDVKELSDELAPVRTFALAGPQGAVSAPIPVAGGLLVAKVRNHLPGRNGQFEDPSVQAELRALCERRVEGEFRAHALKMARDRTEVWRAPLSR
jgi:parvulin-like peptidyl-prolyl isomerase